MWFNYILCFNMIFSAKHITLSTFLRIQKSERGGISTESEGDEGQRESLVGWRKMVRNLINLLRAFYGWKRYFNSHILYKTHSFRHGGRGKAFKRFINYMMSYFKIIYWFRIRQFLWFRNLLLLQYISFISLVRSRY